MRRHRLADTRFPAERLAVTVIDLSCVAPWVPATGAEGQADGVFGDRDAGLIRDAPRRAPGCGLFGRRDTDPPLPPADTGRRPPRHHPPRVAGRA